MSGVAGADAGLPAGEVQDDNGPTPIVVIGSAPDGDGDGLNGHVSANGADTGPEADPGDGAPGPADADTPSRPDAAGTPDAAGAAASAEPADRADPAQPGSAQQSPETVPPRPGTTALRPTPGGAAAAAARDRTAPSDGAAKGKRRISRRTLIQASLIGGAGVAALPLLTLVGSIAPSNEPLPTNLNLSLNTNWLFGGQYLSLIHI